MHANKIAISIENNLLERLDAFIIANVYKNRSQAIQAAVKDKLVCLEKKRLAQECEKLTPSTEQQMADEGFNEDSQQWPEF